MEFRQCPGQARSINVYKYFERKISNANKINKKDWNKTKSHAMFIDCRQTGLIGGSNLPNEI